MSELYIQSLGVFLPAGRMTGAEAVALGLYEEEQLLDGGIESAIVAQGDAPADMAAAAAGAALSRAGIPGASVDLFVHGGVYWQGPEGWSPTGYIMQRAGIGDVASFEIRQGCNGLMAGLELAAGQFALRPGLGRAVLTTALSAESPVIDRWSSAGPGIVLSDAACALVVGRSPGFLRLDSICSLTVADLEGIHRGAEPLVDTAERARVDAVTRVRGWAASAPFPLSEVHSRMAKAFSDAVQGALTGADVRPDQLSRVLFNHLPEHFVESLIMDPLELPMSRSTSEFGRTVGHLGAGDQVVALDHLLREGALSVGDRLLVCSGAPGYNVAAAVLTVVSLPEWTSAA
jgi:3-oxoacyl-[acyl-carrier-protein] synthase-3